MAGEFPTRPRAAVCRRLKRGANLASWTRWTRDPTNRPHRLEVGHGSHWSVRFIAHFHRLEAAAVVVVAGADVQHRKEKSLSPLLSTISLTSLRTRASRLPITRPMRAIRDIPRCVLCPVRCSILLWLCARSHAFFLFDYRARERNPPSYFTCLCAVESTQLVRKNYAFCCAKDTRAKHLMDALTNTIITSPLCGVFWDLFLEPNTLQTRSLHYSPNSHCDH